VNQKKLKRLTVEDVLQLGPCVKYRENDGAYTRGLFAGRESITLMDVLEMDIPPADAVWVASMIMSEPQCRMFAGVVALSVEPIFREQHPDDCRPLNACLAAINLAENPSDKTLAAAMAAAWAAAGAAAGAASWAAARASARAAAWAAALAAAWVSVGAAARAAAWDEKLLFLADVINWFNPED